jgi:hypothetical protein
LIADCQFSIKNQISNQHSTISNRHVFQDDHGSAS